VKSVTNAPQPKQNFGRVPFGKGSPVLLTSHSSGPHHGAPFSMPVKSSRKMEQRTRDRRGFNSHSLRRQVTPEHRLLSPHRYRQGGYSADGLHNSHRTKTNKMRNTNPEIHEQDAGERVIGRVTVLSSTGDAERGILYRTQGRAFGSLVPTTVGQSGKHIRPAGIQSRQEI
jgi:hypothetical protein